MAGVTIELDGSRVLPVLQRLGEHIDDLSPLFGEFGEYLIGATQDRMAREQAPDGTPWAPLSPGYAASKPGGLPVLRLRGHLADDLGYNVSARELDFGTVRIYGAAHQFGRPEINLPARPWLGLSDEHERELLQLTFDYIDEVL